MKIGITAEAIRRIDKLPRDYQISSLWLGGSATVVILNIQPDSKSMKGSGVLRMQMTWKELIGPHLTTAKGLMKASGENCPAQACLITQDDMFLAEDSDIYEITMEGKCSIEAGKRIRDGRWNLSLQEEMTVLIKPTIKNQKNESEF